MFKKIIALFTIIILVSCSASKPTAITTRKTAPVQQPKVVRTTKKPVYTKPTAKVTRTSTLNNTTEVIESTSKTLVTADLITGYVDQYKDIAMGNMKKYGIPASVILAQGILESGAGRGDLAVAANNHFGIKCHKDWLGESVRHDDDEAQECFRKYSEASESYRDHALFLAGKNRYATLFTYEKDDYKAWAKGLRAAGYATDPKYPDKLISYIERYNLHQYDCQVTGKEYKPFEKSMSAAASPKSNSNDPSLYQVEKGDTLYSISKKFNLLVDDLKQKNNLSDTTLSVGQKLIVK
ncbi:glucosaminidase domain-containing protein [Flavobacterium sp. Fl-77]|uniref:Peptidoglycan hydrolase n=1 Tax=Flavobacterium flavipigmentatum TaxID=2893884 RepID=A0AAJ2VYV0_9FLAO|nr:MULTISPECIES: glucosaminidase domain-containing protein [unclassified Flavobacterium]MDX6183106.1 glucosaminidase domain-containing protein [Flavobacterium sp. Fl-33]MDX6186825.1 glucosaminidase domain-containing protein [Flavobacterium sp. Fl-77]UFH40478.1 glucosaminidase domain-containing protein [Flavobacterium sp. F-70]